MKEAFNYLIGKMKKTIKSLENELNDTKEKLAKLSAMEWQFKLNQRDIDIEKEKVVFMQWMIEVYRSITGTHPKKDQEDMLKSF